MERTGRQRTGSINRHRGPPFTKTLDQVDMKTGERNRISFESTRSRLGLYAIGFALMLVPSIVEMKTGIPLGGNWPAAPLSWNELWAQLSDTLLLYLAIAVPIFALIEWSIRRRMKGYSWVSESESETSDSPPKPFTGPWRIANFAYCGVLVIALYVYPYWFGDWGRLPFVAFAPIPISLGLFAVYTGEFWMRGGVFYRGKNPIWYWACIATLLSIGIALFLAGVGVIGT